MRAANVRAMTQPPPPPEPQPAPGAPGAPPASALARITSAYQRRAETDYYFRNAGTDIFLIVITCGIYGLFVLYQLMRRDRDHNRRRYEMLDAANALAWEQASARGLADELRPDFERVAANLDIMRRLTLEFRDPTIWVVIAIFASGIAHIVGYIFIDQDLDTHDRAEGAVEAELAAIYARLGQTLPTPDPARVKGKHNYAGRVIAAIASCGVYFYWWTYNVMVEGNHHFEQNWPWDDALMTASTALAPAA